MIALLPPPQLPIIALLGPTGSGKTELALTLARELRGEIVNCDSVQVYRGFDIGSAKIPNNKRLGIPHHLLDVVGPGDELSAGSYARLAREVIAGIHARNRVPVVVGGTGFYLRALLDGLSPAPLRNQSLRDRLQRMAARRRNSLHRFLRRFDPDAATRIHPNDVPKLVRAIEITILSGEPATRAQSAPRQSLSGITTLKLGLMPDRKLLYARLNERTIWMFHNGLIEETKYLLHLGYLPGSKPTQSLGYKQALQFISGKCSLESAILACQTKTRQYAKRQLTWFRAERDVHWLNGFGSDPHIQQVALEQSNAFLSGFNVGVVHEP
jgi:tRNA dimethylallyltransferase